MATDYKQPHDVTKRVRFYDGQFLQDKDFVDEQKYHVDRQNRLGRSLQIHGVIDGLQVTAAQDKYFVTVSAGTAVDAQGRHVVLADMRTELGLDGLPIFVENQAGFKLPQAAGERWLYMVYHLRRDDLQNISKGLEDYTRWHEAPYIFSASQPIGEDDAYEGPPWNHFLEEGPPSPILLAHLSIAADGTVAVLSQSAYSGLRIPGPHQGAAWIMDGTGRVQLHHRQQDPATTPLTITGDKIGIGTPNPQAKLDIWADTSTAGYWLEALRLSNPAHSAITHPGGRLLFGLHGNRKFYFSSIDPTNPALIDRELMVINADNGFVGIGQTDPGTDISLRDINQTTAPTGITWFNSQPTTYGIHRTEGDWSAPDYQQLRIGFQTGVLIDPGTAYGRSFLDVTGNGLRLTGPSARLGIGTTSPEAALDIRADSEQDSGLVEFRHSNGSQGIGFGFNTIYATGSDDNQPLILRARGTSELIIQSPLRVTQNALIHNTTIGDVGHGAGWAGFRHSALSGANNFALVQNSAGTRTYLNKVSDPNGNGYLALEVDNQPKLVVNDDGHIGIGTEHPTKTLDVRANTTESESIVEFRHANNSQGIGFGFNSIFATGSNTDQNLTIRARGSGHVAIQSNLRVSGPLNITGDVTLPSINNGFIGDVGHSTVWAGFSHKQAAGNQSYSLLHHQEGHQSLLNIKSKPSGNGFIGLRVDNIDRAVLLQNGNFGLGITNPTNRLDVRAASREDGGLVEFRHSSGSQGIGFGHNTIYATGSNADQHLNIQARGTGMINVKSQINFGQVDLTDKPTGMTWFDPNPEGYGIHRTDGPWEAPNYQQLRLGWATGILLDPGKLYGKSYVEVGGLGMRVIGGSLGIGKRNPATPLHVNQNGNFSGITLTYERQRPNTRAVDISNFKMALDSSGFMYFYHAHGGNVGSRGQWMDHEGHWHRISDRSFKTDIMPMRGLLEKVMGLNPVRYAWKDNGKQEFGFIAQEVEPIFPEMVSKRIDEGNTIKGLNYSQFGMIAIGAIQELKQALDDKIKQLEQEIAQLKAKQN